MTEKELKIYYHEGIAANSIEALRQMYIECEIRDYLDEEEIDKFMSKAKSISLDRNKIYVVSQDNGDNDERVTIMDAEDLYDNINNIHKYLHLDYADTICIYEISKKGKLSKCKLILDGEFDPSEYIYDQEYED